MCRLPRIIAICGAKRSGKDTIADVLVTSYGYKKIKIAEHLKSMLQVVFGFSEDQLESNKKDEVDPIWGVTPRVLMQYMGTDIMQYDIQNIIPNIGRTIWIKRVVDTYIEKNKHQKYVISDLRFVHEYDALLKYNAYIIQVRRNKNKDIITDNLHSSEIEYRNIPANIILDNTGDITDINLKIKMVIESIKTNEEKI